uniref:DUF4283 domain-containing protein n=1 Tax=Cannabis sativa TaxID=3483 RepID=A0A803PUM5_CANSA
MAKKKKVGRKPGIRAPAVDEVEGDEEIAEFQVTETSADGLNLIAEMVVHDSITEPEAIASKEIQVETHDFNTGSRGKSWGEESESEQVQMRETVWTSAKKNWESFTRDKNITRDQKLLYTEPQIRDGIKIAQVDLEEVQEQEENWKSAIFCKVLGANPPATVFEGFIRRVWGHLGVQQVAKMNRGLIMVRFNDEATRDQAVEAGVIQFDRKPVIIQPWSADLKSINLVHSVPIWIRLHDLGLQYWGNKSLSALVSTIGKPIMVDQHTKDRTRIQFARVLVEMKIMDAPPKFILYIDEFGQLQDQPIEYEWLPAKCASCSKFGHTKASCRAEELRKERKEGKNLQEKKKTSKMRKGRGRFKGHDLEEQKEELAVGINKKEKQDVVYEFCQLNKIGVCGLLETKLKDDRIKDMINRKFFNWGYYTSSTIDNRILLMWRKNYARVIVIKEDPQSVYCYVKMSGQSKAMCITFVYGYNTTEERKSLWADLMGVQILVASWLVTGDFNALFDIEDRKGGNLVTLGDVEDATNWLAKSHLVPLIKTGSRFTWTNNQEGNKRIYSKIDHTFVNEEWADNFPLTTTHYGWEVVSDHCVCIISMRVDENIGRKPFRYYNFWADHQEFKKVVMEDWSQLVQAVGLKSLFLKLMRLKHKLKKFNKEVIGDIGKTFQEAKDRYMEARMDTQANPHDQLMQKKEKDVAVNFSEHEKMYHSFLRQRSKIDWLCKGDENNAFFHAFLKKRRMENGIVAYTNEQGEVVDKFPEVVKHFVNHFRSYMGSSDKPTLTLRNDCMNQGKCLNIEQQIRMRKPFTSKEIKKAFFSIPDSKSPGPDSFGAGFFKKMWPELGEDFTKAVESFFQTRSAKLAGSRGLAKGVSGMEKQVGDQQQE